MHWLRIYTFPVTLQAYTNIVHSFLLAVVALSAFVGRKLCIHKSFANAKHKITIKYCKKKTKTKESAVSVYR